MKNFLFASLTAVVLTGFSHQASAQFRRHKKKDTKTHHQASQEPLFIENIDAGGEKSGGPIVADGSFHKKSSVKKSVSANMETAEPHLEAFQFKYGQLLNKDVELVTNAPLFKFIDEWWETPYRYGGTSHNGIDCSAFSNQLFTSVYGFELPRTCREQYNICEKIEKDEIKEGDLIFFNTRGGVSHVGVSLGNGYFVHASTSSGVIISSLDEDYYSKRFISGGRVIDQDHATASSR